MLLLLDIYYIQLHVLVLMSEIFYFSNKILNLIFF
jgi:hypothetical protein